MFNKLKKSTIEIPKPHKTLSPNTFQKSNEEVDLTNLKQENDQLKISLKALENQFDSIKKSEQWYKDQFHECQSINYHLQNKLVILEKSVASLSEKNDNRKHDDFDCEKMQNNFINLQKSFQEKLELINKLNIENQLLYSKLDDNKKQITKEQTTKNTCEENQNTQNDNNVKTQICFDNDNKIDQLLDDLQSLNSINSELRNQISMLHNLLKDKENEMRKIILENANYKSMTKSLGCSLSSESNFETNDSDIDFSENLSRKLNESVMSLKKEVEILHEQLIAKTKHSSLDSESYDSITFQFW